MIPAGSKTFTEINGLPFWPESHLLERQHAKVKVKMAVETALLSLNQMWRFQEWEAPILQMDTKSDLPQFNTGDFLLRPETTHGSYVIARRILGHGSMKPPFGIWQAGLSFRREQNHPFSHLHFKQFWQMEMQGIVKDSTKADYISLSLGSIASSLGAQIENVPQKDRPPYSLETIDLVMPFRGRSIEVASCSRRKDFGVEGFHVVEFAFGLDRLAAIATQGEPA